MGLTGTPEAGCPDGVSTDGRGRERSGAVLVAAGCLFGRRSTDLADDGLGELRNYSSGVARANSNRDLDPVGPTNVGLAE